MLTIKNKLFNLLVKCTLLGTFVFSCNNQLKFTPGNSQNAQTLGFSFTGITSITNQTDSSLTLNWNLATDANSYEISKVNTDSSYSQVASVGSTVDAYTITALTPNSNYKYIVQAKKSSGELSNNTAAQTVTMNHAPDVPTSITMHDPLVQSNQDNLPTFKINGVKNLDIIKLFSDSSCSTQIASGTATSNSINLTATTLLPLGATPIYVTSTGVNASTCSPSALITYTVTACPDGYILVPPDANSLVGSPNDFCVMKYEAKAWEDVNTDGIIDIAEVNADGCLESSCSTDNWGLATHIPVSIPESNPWRKISQEAAFNQCRLLNSEATTLLIDNDDNADGTYNLISNPEWMTIARNIELIDSNWTGGSVGNGCLKRGNMDGDGPCTSDDMSVVNSGYNGAPAEGGASRSDGGTAQLSLNNSEVIWDFSGNIWEWINWSLSNQLAPSIADSEKPQLVADAGTSGSWIHIADLDLYSTFAPKILISSSNSSFDNTKGLGQYISGTGGGTPIRSGRSQAAGIFALTLDATPTAHIQYNIGFRCVFRP